MTEVNRLSSWSQLNVVVVGLDSSGFAAADGLLTLGANVTVLDTDDAQGDRAKLLQFLDAKVMLGDAAVAQLPAGTDLVIATPGWSPQSVLLHQAAERGVPIWSEPELAWRMLQPDRGLPWLGVTGSRGTAETAQILAAMLNAGGVRTAAVGTGRPVIEAILDEFDYDVFVVELTPRQLHWSNSLACHSAVVLNVDPMASTWETPAENLGYRDDLAQIYQRVTHSCVYNVAEPLTEELVAEAEVAEGARAIGFTTGIPQISMVGIVDDLLVDRAFVSQRATSALELAKVADLPDQTTGLEWALAAAAMARGYGITAPAIAQGLRESNS